MRVQYFLLAIAISATSSTVNAGEPSASSLRDSLVNKQGYTELSEGFFAKKVGNQDAYMSIGAAGNRAMVEELTRYRDASERSILNRGGEAAEVVAKYDAIINRLSGHEIKTTGSQSGNCIAGSPDVFVSGQSSGGTYAVSNAWNTGAAYTTNRTDDWTTNKGGTITSSQSSTTYGSTLSHSEVSIPNSAMACESVASASVTCPGNKNPVISIFIHELKWFDCRN